MHNLTQTTITYPHLAEADHRGIRNRLMARIYRAKIGDNLFLGYCKTHKRYYIDHSHTDDEIRCPLCEEKWLNKRSISSSEDYRSTQYDSQPDKIRAHASTPKYLPVILVGAAVLIAAAASTVITRRTRKVSQLAG
jgi:hypothetical protein